MVFSISEGMIKFLQVTGAQKKVVTGADAINISGQNDLDISLTLSDFIKNAKLTFTESRVTILIPRSRVILRYMAFPSHDEKEIRSMIDLQLGSHIPYAREEVEIDFQVLSKTEDGYAKVAIVIIPQSIAMRYWKIFSDAKVPINTMTISSVGLWLLYQQQPDLSEGVGGIVDLDTDHSEICLCCKTYWLKSREIPMGSEFIKQWELTLDNTGQEKLPAPVKQVYLVSSVERSSLLGTEMAKAQGDLKIKDILLTQALPLARGALWPEVIMKNGVSIAALAGVAFSTQTPPIDLLPQAVKQASQRSVHQRQMIILGVWIMAALISLSMVLGVGFFKKNIRLARLKQEYHEAKLEASVVERQWQKIADIEGMFKGRLIFSDLAREIGRLQPAGIALVSITISDSDTLSLQGTSINPGDINQFQKALVDSVRFSNVNLDYVNKRLTQQGEVDYFKITCTIRSVSREK